MNELLATQFQADKSATVDTGLSLQASANAPFLYFETAPSYAVAGGVAKIILEATRHIGKNSQGQILVERVMIGQLVGNLAALKHLRSAIDGALLMAEPKPNGPTN